MRQPAHDRPQAPQRMQNIAAQRDDDEVRGNPVPAGAVLDDPAGHHGEDYEPPDAAAEVPEAIPRGGATVD